MKAHFASLSGAWSDWVTCFYYGTYAPAQLCNPYIAKVTAVATYNACSQAYHYQIGYDQSFTDRSPKENDGGQRTEFSRSPIQLTLENEHKIGGFNAQEFVGLLLQTCSAHDGTRNITNKLFRPTLRDSKLALQVSSISMAFVQSMVDWIGIKV